MENTGHKCYGCNEFFHDTNPYVTSHKGCRGKKSLGICVDRKEFGEYYIGNLLELEKSELIQMVVKLTNGKD
jgi:Ni,Fe-hydrogenase I small subunit